MPKLDGAAIEKLGGAAPAAGGNPLGQLNSVINNIRSLVADIQKLRGLAAPASDTGPERGPQRVIDVPPPQGRKPPPEIKELPLPEPPPKPEAVLKSIAILALDFAIEKGLGERTINDLVGLAGPFTIKQARELLK
ncbi:MAG: hypothetical protein A2Z29_04675 [Chloroflexi bacterium RBG_16_56_11]|nr:MAG: hypothetical protein A2Z29_04675 [Chloroflexi bacterium RBG_16_56_11]